MFVNLVQTLSVDELLLAAPYGNFQNYVLRQFYEQLQNQDFTITKQSSIYCASGSNRQRISTKL